MLRRAATITIATCALALPLSQGFGDTKAKPAPAAATPNALPEIEAVPFTDWTIGKPLHFGVHALDADDDHVKIELVEKPADATYNDRTQTVSWTPTAKDQPEGHFRVKVTEYPADGSMPASPRFVEQSFGIRVSKAKVAAPTPQLMSPVTELTVTISDPARLADAKKTYSLAKVLDLVGVMEKTRAPAMKMDPKTMMVPKPAEQLATILKLMAGLHHNPALDPESPSFDKSWGKLENWDLVTIRPRLNRRHHELRLVYLNTAAPETNYIMFRLSIASDMPDVPADVVADSNAEQSRMLYEAFFDGDKLNAKLVADKKAYSKALVGYLDKYLHYQDAKHPKLAPIFLALPNAGRLGGGDMLDDKGNYLWGNGWGWLTFKTVYLTDGKNNQMTYNAPPLKGFTGEIGAAGDHYQPKCLTEVGTACNPEGFTNQPAEGGKKGADGKVMGTPIDAQHLGMSYKKLMVAKTALDDATRRNFEENGMTCVQCHVRKFDEGNLLDPGVWNPQKRTGATKGRPIPTLFFVIVPQFATSAFTQQAERDAECLLSGTFMSELGKQVTIPCASRGE